MKHNYVPNGVCSRLMSVEIEDNKIVNCRIVGGCNGNLQGICRLVEGMDPEDAVEKLRGINCNGRGTSCPDQLAICIEEALEEI